MEEGVKISEMTELESVTGNEYFPVVDSSGENKKVKTGKIARKEDIPDVSGFITTESADAKYQPKGEKPKGGYNRALFESAGAHFNEGTGFYELNGLTDITEQEMNEIYNNFNFTNITGGHINFWQLQGLNARTNLKFKLIALSKGTVVNETHPTINLSFTYSTNLKYIKFCDEDYQVVVNKDSINVLYANSKLVKVIGILNVEFVKSFVDWFDSYGGIPNLEEIYLKGLNKNISISSAPKLNKESILFMIKNSKATSPITIKLHATAYEMAMADEDIQAALQEKTNVSLATA